MDATCAMSTQKFKASSGGRIGTVSCDAQSSNEDGNNYLTRTAGGCFATSTRGIRPTITAALLLNADWGGRKGRTSVQAVRDLLADPTRTPPTEQAIEAQLAANAKTFGTITNLADTPR